jgi:hydrogenase maturation protease
MNQRLVDRVVRALMYEGYLLYPYRPSVKNRQRWTFGGLYPPDFCRASAAGDAAGNQTECLVRGSRETTFDVSVRFLHLIERAVGKVSPPIQRWADDSAPSFQAVESLRIGNRLYETWREVQERNVDVIAVRLDEVLREKRHQSFAIPALRWFEPLREAGQIAGLFVRRQEAVHGNIEISATQMSQGVFRLSLGIANQATMPPAADASRDVALAHSLLSTHSIIVVRQGEFISIIDPPEPLGDSAAACRNIGTWPVLVGEHDATDAILSSPIILYDYPRLAPESPGDLFDGTEIDEILTLRILTLTEEEKRAGAALDDRCRELLARSEQLAREQLAGLHGAMRDVHPSALPPPPDPLPQGEVAKSRERTCERF